MKGLRFVSGVYVLICMLVGYLLFRSAGGWLPFGGVLLGAAVGGALFLLGYLFWKGPVGKMAGGLIGLVLGLVMGRAGVWALDSQRFGEAQGMVDLFLVLGLGYLGMILGVQVANRWRLDAIRRLFRPDAPTQWNRKILDTSVIIDGRIADLCETGFLEGTFVVPQFILRELQHIADSPDPLKRARGRRGLDILQRMQKMPQVDVQIVDDDFPRIRQVDSKIVALAKRMHAKILTHDMNLNKIAELQGVTVLNINELCNALRPVVLPGESMRVFVLKEGKEYNQGVAYLDDGTMIVIEDAKPLIGRNVDVVVTSVLQTAAGRMIFSKLKNKDEVGQEVSVGDQS